MSSPSAVIIIANWNGRRFLDDCLRSALSQDHRCFRVVLVDNGSSDGSVPFVKERFPGVEVMALDRNLGFAAANNMAMRRALDEGVRYVALLNNDTSSGPGWLGALASAMDADPGVGICAAKLLRMDDPGVLDSTGHIFWGGLIYDRGGGEPDAGQYDGKPEVAGACAAACLYRADMLREIGLFDESFGSYYEDAELTWRAHKAGWKARYVPSAVVLHKRYGSSSGDEAARRAVSSRGAVNIARTAGRHASLPAKLRISLSWLRGAAGELAGRGGPDYLMMLKVMWFGV